MSKCTMCIDRLEEGLRPICVLSCSLRALDFGPIEELRAKYGELRQLEDMPEGGITGPAVVFKPHDEKREVIPWNADRGPELWRERGPFAPGGLPPVLQKKTDLTGPPKDIIGRGKPVLKAKSIREMMYYTTDDE